MKMKGNFNPFIGYSPGGSDSFFKGSRKVFFIYDNDRCIQRPAANDILRGPSLQKIFDIIRFCFEFH